MKYAGGSVQKWVGFEGFEGSGSWAMERTGQLAATRWIFLSYRTDVDRGCSQ